MKPFEAFANVRRNPTSCCIDNSGRIVSEVSTGYENIESFEIKLVVITCVLLPTSTDPITLGILGCY